MDTGELREASPVDGIPSPGDLSDHGGGVADSQLGVFDTRQPSDSGDFVEDFDLGIERLLEQWRDVIDGPSAVEPGVGGQHIDGCWECSSKQQQPLLIPDVVSELMLVFPVGHQASSRLGPDVEVIRLPQVQAEADLGTGQIRADVVSESRLVESVVGLNRGRVGAESRPPGLATATGCSPASG